MKTRSVFYLAIAAALLATACNGQNEQSVARRSSDGTQEGTITLSNDGTSGSVSSSSQGTRQARASSTLVIGPGTTQGSFEAEGDTQQVSDTLSVDPEEQEEDVEPVQTTPLKTEEKEEEEEEEESTPVKIFEEEEEVKPDEGDVVEEQTLQEEEPEQKEAQQPASAPKEKEEEAEGFFDEDSLGDGEDGFEEEPYTFGDSGTVIFSSSGHNTEDAEKICLVGDDSKFQKYLDDGYEVTLVQATENGQVKITTALEWPGVSTKNSITSRYIPEEIKERCDVTYEDLGLEDRPDGESSLSSSGSSFHFSSSSGSSSYTSTSSSDIKRRVFGNLCNQPFFRNFALHDECKEHGDYGDIEDEDDFPWG